MSADKEKLKTRIIDMMKEKTTKEEILLIVNLRQIFEIIKDMINARTSMEYSTF